MVSVKSENSKGTRQTNEKKQLHLEVCISIAVQSISLYLVILKFTVIKYYLTPGITNILIQFSLIQGSLI